MIGYRGCYRYVKEPELFALELEVLARVREETPNLHLMIPFVRTLWELEACLELVDASPLGRQRGLHRWVMAEVPSVVYRIPDYAALGIDGVSIGSNDLTQLMLGVDRDSEVCAELFDESDAAVLDAIGRIIEARTRGRHHVVAVRPGPVEPARVRRAARALRHHVDLGERRRDPAIAAGDRGRRAAAAWSTRRGPLRRPGVDEHLGGASGHPVGIREGFRAWVNGFRVEGSLARTGSDIGTRSTVAWMPSRACCGRSGSPATPR